MGHRRCATAPSVYWRGAARRGRGGSIGRSATALPACSVTIPSWRSPTNAASSTRPRCSPPASPSTPNYSAAETLTALSQMLGAYPFSTLSLAENPSTDSQGWPGLVFLSSYVYLSPEQRAAFNLPPADQIIYGDVMMPHELAHQWFGDKVSWASYHEQWLMEGLANYCWLLLLERTRPADVKLTLQTYRNWLASKSKEGRPNVEAGPVTLGIRLSSSHFPNGYEIITYGRGTWLIHMLRCMLRDASRTPEK